MLFRSATDRAVSGAEHYWKAITSSLKGSKTECNLKAAFAKEPQANCRYLYFARTADAEGYEDVSAVFHSIGKGKTGHAQGHLEYLEGIGDPASATPIGSITENLRASIAAEAHECTDVYSGIAKTARDEGLDEIADWFEILAKAVRSPYERFKKALD